MSDSEARTWRTVRATVECSGPWDAPPDEHGNRPRSRRFRQWLIFSTPYTEEEMEDDAPYIEPYDGPVAIGDYDPLSALLPQRGAREPMRRAGQAPRAKAIEDEVAISELSTKEGKILNALDLLDHDNDDHWTTRGAPRVGVVNELSTGDTYFTAEDIKVARPGFARIED